MKARKQLWFIFADTEAEARRTADYENANLSAHYRKHHPSSYTPWRSADGTENKFIVWTWR